MLARDHAAARAQTSAQSITRTLDVWWDGRVVGALQLLAPGETQTALNVDQRLTPLDGAALIRVLDTLPTRPLMA